MCTTRDTSVQRGCQLGSEVGMEAEVSLRTALQQSVCSGSQSALLEAVALTVHLKDVDVVSQAVQQSAGQPL